MFWVVFLLEGEPSLQSQVFCSISQVFLQDYPAFSSIYRPILSDQLSCRKLCHNMMLPPSLEQGVQGVRCPPHRVLAIGQFWSHLTESLLPHVFCVSSWLMVDCKKDFL
ncbi:hypothetical protein ILYODFUR_019462 [Ilyodon furcidens]|uniref:Uncharacterized protein n=1 Tax=Ilyodon furcidens TaxID=33524 RepID=A0ABV0SNH1_9TELE